MSQLEATKKQTEERVRLKMEDKMKKKKKLVKKNEKGDIRHVLFEHCLQNLDKIQYHLLPPFQKHMVDLILICDNATELRDVFERYNKKMSEAVNNGGMKNLLKNQRIEKIFDNHLKWNDEEDAEDNIMLLQGVLGIIRENCKHFWKTIWKDKDGSTKIWTNAWKGLLKRFDDVRLYLHKNKRPTYKKVPEEVHFHPPADAIVDAICANPTDANYDDEVPAWWGWGNDGPPDSSADESDSDED